MILFKKMSVMSWCLVALFVFILYQAMDGRLILHGDSREYLIQTQAIVFHHSLRVDTEKIRKYWNRTAPFDELLTETYPPADRLVEEGQAGGGFGGLYPDRFGKYRYYHFWAYSLAVAPVYAVLHVLDPTRQLEYQAFRIMNVALLFLPLWVAWRRGRSWPLLGVITLLLVSPLIPYTDWMHPELFCFSLVLLSFLVCSSPRARYWGPLLLGLAATQNPPIALFFPVHAYLFFSPGNGVSAPRWLPAAAAYLAGVVVVAASIAYFRFHFGVWNVIAALRFADLSYCSPGRALHLLFSPLTGAAWFFPAAFFFLLPACRRESVLFIVAAAVSVFAAAWFASSTANFNAGQVGATRYAVWLIAPLTFAVLHVDWLPRRLGRNGRTLAFALAAAATVAVIFGYRTYELTVKKLDRFGGSWRAQPEVAAVFRAFPYPDDPETLAENILGHEAWFPAYRDPVYIWNLGPGKSLWLLPGDAIRHTTAVRWRHAGLPSYRSIPRNDLLALEGGDLVLRPGRATNTLWSPQAERYVLLFVDAAMAQPSGADGRVIIRTDDTVTGR